MKKNHPTILCLFAIALSMSSAACSANPKKSVEAETANVDVQSKAIEAPADTPSAQAAPADTPTVQAAPQAKGDATHSDAAIKARVKEICNKASANSNNDPESKAFLSQSFRKLVKKMEDLGDTGAFGDVGYFYGCLLSQSEDFGTLAKCWIIAKSGNIASVQIYDIYHPQGAAIWKMVFENGNWYVDDVISLEGYSSRDRMNEYLNSNR